MKIAFLAPIEKNIQQQEHYAKIIHFLIKNGHTVVHAFSPSKEYFANFYNEIGKCDIVIAECSIPSVHVGYEISNAIQQGKDVIMIKHNDKSSSNLDYDPLYLHKNIFMYLYKDDNLLQTLKIALEYNPVQKYKKFNILFSPDMVTKLNTISRNKNLPKSVYIRQLIEQGLAHEELE